MAGNNGKGRKRIVCRNPNCQTTIELPAHDTYRNIDWRLVCPRCNQPHTVMFLPSGSREVH